MQCNDKKIEKLLNEHIRKRPHSPGNPATISYRAVCTPQHDVKARNVLELRLVPCAVRFGDIVNCVS